MLRNNLAREEQILLGLSTERRNNRRASNGEAGPCINGLEDKTLTRRFEACLTNISGVRRNSVQLATRGMLSQYTRNFRTIPREFRSLR